MSSFPGSPKLLKGGLILTDPVSGAVQRIISLQYNPDTLTRTLAIMRRHGWLAIRSGQDRRERRLRLSKTGQAELARATPHWEDAQSAVRARLGDKRWHNLMRLANQATSLVAG